MTRRFLALVTALALLALMPLAATARGDHATLIRVHVFHAAKPGGGTANCSNEQTAGNTYALTGWKVASNTTAHLNLATVPAGLSGVATQLQNSFDAWAGSTSVPDIAVATDGTATKQTANHSYDLMWGRTSGNSIAVTYTWRWSTGEIESDTVFNRNLPWFVAPSVGDGCDETTAKYDVANIATHEFGHTYGMDHPSGDRFETMYAYGYTGETLKRTLGNGDISGITALY